VLMGLNLMDMQSTGNWHNKGHESS